MVRFWRVLCKLKFGDLHENNEFIEKAGLDSRSFRRIISNKYTVKKPLEIRQLTTYTRILNINGQNLPVINVSCHFKLWTSTVLNNKIKTFAFKSVSNCLGVGSRVVHINPQIDPSCTFCRKKGYLPAPLETFEHIFSNCPLTLPITEQIFERFIAQRYSPDTYFFGIPCIEKKEISTVMIIFTLLRYVIWTKKLKKQAPCL